MEAAKIGAERAVLGSRFPSSPLPDKREPGKLRLICLRGAGAAASRPIPGRVVLQRKRHWSPQPPPPHLADVRLTDQADKFRRQEDRWGRPHS